MGLVIISSSSCNSISECLLSFYVVSLFLNLVFVVVFSFLLLLCFLEIATDIVLVCFSETKEKERKAIKYIFSSLPLSIFPHIIVFSFLSSFSFSSHFLFSCPPFLSASSIYFLLSASSSFYLPSLLIIMSSFLPCFLQILTPANMMRNVCPQTSQTKEVPQVM